MAHLIKKYVGDMDHNQILAYQGIDPLTMNWYKDVSSRRVTGGNNTIFDGNPTPYNYKYSAQDLRRSTDASSKSAPLTTLDASTMNRSKGQGQSSYDYFTLPSRKNDINVFMNGGAANGSMYTTTNATYGISIPQRAKTTSVNEPNGYTTYGKMKSTGSTFSAKDYALPNSKDVYKIKENGYPNSSVFTVRSPAASTSKHASVASRTRASDIFREPSFGTDEYYLRKMADVLNRNVTGYFPSSPTKVTNFMFIGGYTDADNWRYLKRLGITHVLNCAGNRRTSRNPYPSSSGIVGYEEFDADDHENYNVMQHFPRAKAFIDRAKYNRGKVLVHCAMGINRSGAMCISYLMYDEKMPLMDAVRYIKQKRGTVLCNPGFQRQVLKFARQKNLL